MFDSIGLAFRSLIRNPARTGLTVLGLAIGVAAFIAMVSFGNGARASVVGQFARLGVNVISVNPAGARPGGLPASPLDDADLRALETEGVTIDFLVPVLARNVLATWQGQNLVVPLRATTPRYRDIKTFELRAGGFFDDDDTNKRSKVCVLGTTTAETLFGTTEPLGQVVRLQDRLQCRVIGVTFPLGVATSGRDLDNFVVLPYTTYRTYLGGPAATFNAIDIRPKADASRDAVQAEVSEILRRTHRLPPDVEDDFRFRSPDDAIQVADSVASILRGLLAAIASVSLIVGGIGIMNIQLVSVTERTQEIGVRSAIGARPGQIMQQFLIEAVVLALLGTFIGAVAGTIAALLVAEAMRWPTEIPFTAIGISVLFGVCTGVLFGYLPARRAALLDPVEALRRA